MVVVRKMIERWFLRKLALFSKIPGLERLIYGEIKLFSKEVAYLGTDSSQ